MKFLLLFLVMMALFASVTLAGSKPAPKHKYSKNKGKVHQG